MKTEFSIAVPIIVAVLTVITLTFLIIAAFSDPGMILRRPLKGQIELCRRPSLINQAGFLRTYRYCGTCSIIRPNRSTHCGDCNNCVERFDHHCPWIGNCAGRRNYVYFYSFLLILNVLTVFIGVFCIAHIAVYVNREVQNSPTAGSVALSDCVISLFVVIYCALSMLFTTGLFIYHTRLISHNITTKEELKNFFDNPFGNPFERNYCKNWKSVLCPKLRKMDILKYFKLCKDSKGVVITEEKKALKDYNREMIVLDDKPQHKVVEKTIESQLTTNKYNNNNYDMAINGMNNNLSDNTSIADKKNGDYFRRESKVSQSEIKLENLEKRNTSMISEKYSNCSENLSNSSEGKKVIPSLCCQIGFHHSNGNRDDSNMNYNNHNQEALNQNQNQNEKSKNGEHRQIQPNKVMEYGRNSSID